MTRTAKSGHPSCHAISKQSKAKIQTNRTPRATLSQKHQAKMQCRRRMRPLLRPQEQTKNMPNSTRNHHVRQKKRTYSLIVFAPSPSPPSLRSQGQHIAPTLRDRLFSIRYVPTSIPRQTSYLPRIPETTTDRRHLHRDSQPTNRPTDQLRLHKYLINDKRQNQNQNQTNQATTTNQPSCPPATHAARGIILSQERRRRRLTCSTCRTRRLLLGRRGGRREMLLGKERRLSSSRQLL